MESIQWSENILYWVACGLYGLTALLAAAQEFGELKSPWLRARFALTPLALLAHGWLLYGQLFPDGLMHFGFALALSTMTWLLAALTWIEGVRGQPRVLEMLGYGLAAVGVGLPNLFPGYALYVEVTNVWFKVHCVSAIAAYSMMLLAVGHAALMGWQERRLHGGMSAELFRLPPLLVMERLLFRLLALGFVLLSLTLVSGGVFSEMAYHRWLKFDHKTVFAVLSWAMFGVLLLGRTCYGWRGRTARLWVFMGFGTLLLAYVGSRFVLEVLLHRAA